MPSSGCCQMSTLLKKRSEAAKAEVFRFRANQDVTILSIKLVEGGWIAPIFSIPVLVSPGTSRQNLAIAVQSPSRCVSLNHGVPSLL